jgi:hypothetical protein
MQPDRRERRVGNKKFPKSRLARIVAAAQGPPPRLRVSGSPGVIAVTSAVAGSQPTAVTNSATTYDVRVGNNSVMKITARLDAPPPPGMTVTISPAAPAGATSLGPVALDMSARDVVVNISGVNSQAITYQVSAPVSAGVVAPAIRTVTFNLVSYP